MIKRKKLGRASKKPTEAELASLYSQMTAKEVASHYGVSESTVRKWVADYRKQEEENNGN